VHASPEAKTALCRYSYKHAAPQIEQPRAQPRPPTLSSAAVHKVHKKSLFIGFNTQELALINLSAIECVSNQSPLLLLQ
jgi:hypothetical protein